MKFFSKLLVYLRSALSSVLLIFCIVEFVFFYLQARHARFRQ